MSPNPNAVSWTERLNTAAQGAAERARAAGLPVDTARRLLDERVEPRLVKAARTDVRIEVGPSADGVARIEAETLANGKAELSLAGGLTDRDRDIVAHSRAVYPIRPRRR